MMDFKDNFNELMTSFRERKGKIIRALENGLTDGMHAFHRQNIIRNQLSGRRSENYGLNRQSGMAAGAWQLKTYNRGGIDFVAILGLAERAWYLKVHQHYDGFTGHIYPKNKPFLFFKVNTFSAHISKSGNKYVRKMSNWVRTKHVFIPKRLYISEEFSESVPIMIRAAVNQRVKEALAA